MKNAAPGKPGMATWRSRSEMEDPVPDSTLAAEAERYRALAQQYARRAEVMADPQLRDSCEALAESYMVLANANERFMLLFSGLDEGRNGSEQAR
jgi:hypothetical protein